jgi:hypothetical protein
MSTGSAGLRGDGQPPLPRARRRATVRALAMETRRTANSFDLIARAPMPVRSRGASVIGSSQGSQELTPGLASVAPRAGLMPTQGGAGPG